MAIAIVLAVLAAPSAAIAQVSSAVKAGLGFLNTGAYYFSGNAGSSRALGTPKFLNEAGYFGKPRHFGGLAVSGGITSVNASDHFLPFSGGNEFNLIGPSARVSYGADNARVHPFASFGLFAGRVRSVSQRFDRTEFTPSGTVGVEVGLTRNFSVVGSYRLSREIHGVNTDGVGVSLKIF